MGPYPCDTDALRQRRAKVDAVARRCRSIFLFAKKQNAWTSLRGGKPHKEVHALCYTQRQAPEELGALWVLPRLDIALSR